MTGALLVIPLAAMLVPILAILIAVLVDVFFLGAILVRMWHDRWAVPGGSFFGNHLVRPIRHLLHLHHPVPR